MHTIPHLLVNDVPFMTPGALKTLSESAHTVVKDLDPQNAEAPILTRIREALRPKMTVTDDGIALVPIEGMLALKPHPLDMVYSGPEDYQNISSMLSRARGDELIRGVLLDMGHAWRGLHGRV